MNSSSSIEVDGIVLHTIDWSEYFDSEETYLVDEALEDMQFGVFRKRFKDEKIDYQSLMTMNSHHISRLLPDVPIGVLIKFEQALENWRRLNGEPISDFFSTQPKTDATKTFQVKSILNSTVAGKEFLEKFESTRIIKNSDRKLLVKLLNGFFSVNKIILGVEQIEAISQDIAAVFPHESSTYYFDREKGRGTGALYTAHNNMLKKMRKLKIIPSTRKRKNEDNSNFVETAEIKFTPDEIYSNNFLKQSSANISLDLLISHWKNSFRIRYQSYKNDKDVGLSELYRVLVRADATILIDIDFNLMYPDADINFQEEWTKIENKLVDILLRDMKKNTQFKSLKNINAMSNNQKVATILSSLHSFLFSPTVIYGKSNYKSTIPDTLQSFLFLDPDEASKDIRINAWETNLKQRNLNPQAYIIGFGNTYESIGNKFCVKVDNIQYFFESDTALIEAIELLMKIFHVFDLHYPILNTNVHLFLSKLFFQIPNDTKKNYAKIEQLINELK